MSARENGKAPGKGAFSEASLAADNKSTFIIEPIPPLSSIDSALAEMHATVGDGPAWLAAFTRFLDLIDQGAADV